MQTLNGQSACLEGYSASTTVDTRYVSKVQKPLWPVQAEFIDFLTFHGVEELSKSLQLVHGLALYHSDVPFDSYEKSALFNVKILSEQLAGLVENQEQSNSRMPVMYLEDNLYV